MTGREKSQWLKCGRIEEEIRIKALRSIEEVASTSLRELDETLQRDAAATKHTAAPADATPSLGQTEAEMRTDDKEGASLSDGSDEGWTMVDMRTDDKDGWRSHTRWARDGWRGSWSGRRAWDGWRGSWSGWPAEPSPWGSWRWNGYGYGWDWSGAQ